MKLFNHRKFYDKDSLNIQGAQDDDNQKVSFIKDSFFQYNTQGSRPVVKMR